MVASALRAHHPGLAISIHTMTTKGDNEQGKDLAAWGYKGLFTRELEDALLLGQIDIAVHSMKDMPSELPGELSIAAILPRDDVRDAWISPHHETIEALPKGGVVGTSSVRRAAQLKRLRPDIQIIPFRGNVGTRLEKLASGLADATFLAAAGLDRLGLGQHIRTRIPVTHMCPAVAQGAIGVEARTQNTRIAMLLAPIHHTLTAQQVTAERAMLRVLDGSCRTPIGAHTHIEGDTLTLYGEILAPDGSAHLAETLKGRAEDAEAIGAALGESLRARAPASMRKQA